ncbi:hypothetical protein [Auraticoccus monumenti]|uniref:Uncharacterized protein n=1 Tax=Auraticoccus monumenti TaxID=675864 RepID=A0A1G6USV9_9ACTN|nr:hypothetical protein [Auraticoccus monumenti]SDD43796.1 hypothetical protein SAMN04489747_0947 [Auraticoccus monumenti]
MRIKAALGVIAAASMVVTGCSADASQQAPPAATPTSSSSSPSPSRLAATAFDVGGHLVDDYQEFDGAVGDLCESKRMKDEQEIRLIGAGDELTSIVNAGRVDEDYACAFRFYFGAVPSGSYEIEISEGVAASISVGASMEPLQIRLPAAWSDDELAYLEWADVVADSDEAASTVAAAREACDNIANSDQENAIAGLVDEATDETRAAVKYLCPEHEEVLEVADRSFGQGSYKVRTQGSRDEDDVIQPGTYRTRDGVEDCYWERVEDNGEIRSNELVGYAPEGVEITLLDTGGGFSSERCGVWYRQ